MPPSNTVTKMLPRLRVSRFSVPAQPAHGFHPRPCQTPLVSISGYPWAMTAAGIRAYATNPPAATLSKPSPTGKPAPPAPPPRDENIPFRFVQLVGLDNKLSPVQPLSAILRTYNKSTHTLTIVSSSPPIVKLIDKSKVNEQQRAAKEKSKQKKAKRMEDVEIQISWESASGDVEHKLSRARSVLEDGNRVKLTFAHKQGSETSKLAGSKLIATQTSLPAHFLDSLESIAIEFKPPRSIPTGDIHILHLQPSKEIRQKVVEEVERTFDSKGEEKKRLKEENRQREERRAKKAREAEEALAKQRREAQVVEVFTRDVEK